MILIRAKQILIRMLVVISGLILGSMSNSPLLGGTSTDVAQHEQQSSFQNLLSPDLIQEGIFEFGTFTEKVSAEWFSGPSPDFALVINPDLNVPSWDYREFARTVALMNGAAYIVRHFASNPMLPNNIGKPFDVANYLRAGAPGLNGLPPELAKRHLAKIPVFLIGFGFGAHALVASERSTNIQNISGIILYGATNSFWIDSRFNTRTTYAYGSLDNRTRFVRRSSARYRYLEIPQVNHTCMTTNGLVGGFMDLTNSQSDSPFDTTECSLQLLTTLEVNQIIWRLGGAEPQFLPTSASPIGLPPGLGIPLIPVGIPELGRSKGEAATILNRQNL